MSNMKIVHDALRDARVANATTIATRDFALSKKERTALILLVWLGVNAIGRYPRCPAYKIGRNKAYKLLAEHGYRYEKGEWLK